MTLTRPSGAASVAAPDSGATPDTLTAAHRGVGYVIDLAACRQAVNALRLRGRTAELVETIAGRAGVRPEVVGRFLAGHAVSARAAVLIATEIVRARDDLGPPFEGSARSLHPVRPGGRFDGVLLSGAP